jgi:hypothetical protein
MNSSKSDLSELTDILFIKIFLYTHQPGKIIWILIEFLSSLSLVLKRQTFSSAHLILYIYR